MEFKGEHMRKFLGILALLLVGLLFYSNLIAADIGSKRLIKEETFDVSPGEELNLKTDLGDVKINTWDKNEFNVKIKGSSRVEDKMDFYIERTNNGVKIIGEKEGRISGWSFFSSGPKLIYEINLPKNFDLKIKTSGGDISVKDLKGLVALKTSGGDIKLKQFEGSSDVSTSGGDITVENSGGDLLAHTSGGDILLESANGKVDASTSGGDIKVKYAGENNGMDLHTSGGDIDLYLSMELKADVYLKTSGGRVDVDFENARASRQKKTRYEGSFNGGGERLKATTSGGDINVRAK